MREYLILTFTFTAPFIMLFLLNVLIDDLPRLCSVLRELSTKSTSSTMSTKSTKE